MGMGGWSGGEPGEPLSEINVTPLVDVMLVLLVIFIVAAPLMAQALRVELPRVGAPTQSDPVVIELVVRQDGVVELEGREVANESLEGALRQAVAAKPEGVLRFGGDGRVSYQRVAEVLATARQAGIQRIAFATRAPAGEEGPMTGP